MTEPAQAMSGHGHASGPVFVSYATADHKEALSVCKAIERRGLECWISTRDVAPGENYQEAIVRSLRGSRAMVLVFSEAANNSDEVKKELSLASRYHVPVMALRINDVEPSDAFTYELSTRQWIDAFKGREKALDALVRRVAQIDGAAAFRPVQRPRLIDRRQGLIGGGAIILASAGALGWVKFRGHLLPREAQALIDEGHAALNEATPDELATAVARFRHATEIAPTYAEPWGALAYAYARQSWVAPSPQDRLIRSRAAEARTKALAIDQNNGDALAAGILSLPLYRNWLQFERECRIALQRQPNHSGLNLALGFCLLQVGRTRTALDSIDAAITADPASIAAHAMKIASLDDLNRLDDAETEVEADTRQWPRHYSIWFTRFYYLAGNGRAADAIAMVDDLPNRPLGIPEWNFNASRLQARALQTRSPDDIVAAMKVTLETARRGAGFAENAMMFATSVGRVDDAFNVIDAYFFGRGFKIANQRYSSEQGQFAKPQSQLTYMFYRKYMGPLRSDPRFHSVVQSIGLEDYWRRSGTKPDYLA